MYTSKINIKHRRHAEIHWGVHKETGKMVWIDDVEANGLACNCKCACCDTDLIACTKGKVHQKHYFKHQANNNCYYGDEIAEYLKACEILKSLTTISLPAVGVRIGKRGEVLIPSSEVSIKNILCHHDANHYPPLLTTELGGQVTRIVLAFDGYYSQSDYMEFATEAKNNHWNCLAILLPHLDYGSSITADDLSSCIDGINRNKRWIFHTSEEEARAQLTQNASVPARVRINYGEPVYACPLHKRERSGTFYAYEQDCADCEFNLVLSPVCLCMAEAYIKSLADFDIPIEERTEKFLAHRKANEDVITKQRSVKGTAPRLTDEQYLQQQKGSQRSHEETTNTVPACCEKYKRPPTRKTCTVKQIRNENYDQEDYLIYDSFGHQWMKCTRCESIMLEHEAARHITCNKGICSECFLREGDDT